MSVVNEALDLAALGNPAKKKLVGIALPPSTAGNSRHRRQRLDFDVVARSTQQHVVPAEWTCERGRGAATRVPACAAHAN